MEQATAKAQELVKVAVETMFELSIEKDASVERFDQNCLALQFDSRFRDIVDKLAAHFQLSIMEQFKLSVLITQFIWDFRSFYAPQWYYANYYYLEEQRELRAAKYAERYPDPADYETTTSLWA